MFADIVFPKGNEEEFIRLAKRLSIPGLCIAYPYNRKENPKLMIEKIRKLQEKTEIKLFFGLLARRPETREARKLADLVIVKSTPENREVLEERQVDMVFGLEDNPKPDPMHYRYSSLNQVLCSIAAENRTILSFPFRMCLIAEPERRAVLFGRISQNIRMCRKYNVNTVIASFAEEPYEMRNPDDLYGLGMALGMTPGQAKAAVGSVWNKLIENQKIRSGKRVAEGIEFID
jgi:RNase P/RNase MRP subunit p30